jgi:hypothetical protein
MWTTHRICNDSHIKGLKVRINGSCAFQLIGKLKGTRENCEWIVLCGKLKHAIAQKRELLKHFQMNMRTLEDVRVEREVSLQLQELLEREEIM